MGDYQPFDMEVCGRRVTVTAHALERIDTRLGWTLERTLPRLNAVLERWALDRAPGDYHVECEGATWVFRCRPHLVIILTVLTLDDVPFGTAKQLVGYPLEGVVQGLPKLPDLPDVCECGLTRTYFFHRCPLGAMPVLKFGCEACGDRCGTCDASFGEFMTDALTATTHTSLPVPKPRPAATPTATGGTRSQMRSLSVSGVIPSEAWDRFGHEVVSKLLSGPGVNAEISFTLTVDGHALPALEGDLRRALTELGLNDQVCVRHDSN